MRIKTLAGLALHAHFGFVSAVSLEWRNHLACQVILVLFGIEKGNVPADGFGLTVTERTFSAFVPGADDAIQISRHHRIMSLRQDLCMPAQFGFGFPARGDITENTLNHLMTAKPEYACGDFHRYFTAACVEHHQFSRRMHMPCPAHHDMVKKILARHTVRRM